MSRWVTFDCYGTLVDWEQGMVRAMASVAPGQERALLDAYHRLEAEVEAERPFRSYRAVLAETFRRAARRLGITLPAGAETILAETLPDWPVFPDVAPALTAVRAAGWRLAILSNVDRDLLAGTRQRILVTFDAVVTAEDVQAYKPAPDHFHTFRQSYGVDKEDWVHVARSRFHDIEPATRLGIRCVWINRGGEPGDPSLPAATLPDLTGLPSTVSQVGSPGPGVR